MWPTTYHKCSEQFGVWGVEACFCEFCVEECGGDRDLGYKVEMQKLTNLKAGLQEGCSGYSWTQRTNTVSGIKDNKGIVLAIVQASIANALQI